MFISQPPLSRHIRHLETLLGVTLFVRHTKGLILTAEGERVLELIRPLLALQETTLSALGQLSDDRQQPLRLGLTTAFEQGILRLWNRRWVARPVRFPPSPLVACPCPASAQRQAERCAGCAPLDADGLTLSPLPYHEALIAALPASWPESAIPGWS